MTAKKKDTWSSLASMLGIAGSSKPEPETEVETLAEETASVESIHVESPVSTEVVELPPPHAEVTSTIPAEVVTPVNPVSVVEAISPPAPKPPKRRDRWDSLLGQLGLATPAPEAELAAEPEPEPPPKFTAKKNVSRTPFLKSPPPREPVAKTPPAPVVAPTPIEPPTNLDEDAAEGPPGYQGPDLLQRLEAEREVERQKIANQRSSFDKLFQAGAKRTSGDDEVNYDDDLNSGLKALWEDHDSQAATTPEVPKREEPRREFPRREESRREESRREESRRSEPRREGPRREEPRRDELMRDEPRREVARREDVRRDEPRRDDPRRDEPRRDRNRRDEIRSESYDAGREIPLDEVPHEIDDLEEDLLLDAPRENLAGGEGDFPRKRRRRRRGRRRGGKDRETTDAVAGPDNVEAPRDFDEDEFIDPLLIDESDLDKESLEDAPRQGVRGRDEAGRPPRKRRRRRRRDEETPAVAKAKPVEVDDDFDDEFDGPASLDYLSDEKGEDGHKGIPTWDDAIGCIVTANMEARGSRPSHGAPRGRGGGRDRDGGRGRGDRR